LLSIIAAIISQSPAGVQFDAPSLATSGTPEADILKPCEPREFLPYRLNANLCLVPTRFATRHDLVMVNEVGDPRRVHGDHGAPR
jgi:hypothetical protein